MSISNKVGGRRPLDRTQFSDVFFDDRVDSAKICADCGSPCWVCSHRSRSIQTLDGSWTLRGRGRKCNNPECPAHENRTPPWNWWYLSHLVVKGTGYGLDVVCYIGKAYLAENMSLPRIHNELCETYDLQISERHVSNLFKLFLALVEGRNLANDCVVEHLRAQGGIILSADAVTFDETSPSLFVVRDVPSGEILYVRRLDGADGKRSQLYSEVLRKVQSCEVPVRGVVTDKEASLVAAVREVFPDIPHQFCQAHYLQNMKRLFEPELSEMAKAVREIVRLTKETEREFKAAEPNEERQLVLDLCRVIKTQGKTQGDNLTNPTAFKRYKRLTHIAETVDEALKREGSWPHLNRLGAILSGLVAQRNLGQLLDKQIGVVRAVAHILQKKEATSSAVVTELDDYLQALDNVTFQDLRWARFVNGAQRLSERYWPGLFCTYDLSELPATNNDLESFFGALKRQQRRVTGKQKTSGGPLETCAPFVIGAWNLVQGHPELVPLLSGLPREKIAQAKVRLKQLAEPAKLKRRVARDPEGYLSNLLSGWLDSDSNEETEG